jgi:alpha-ketoglutarate-dependent taurine dioxygenase
VKIEPSGATLGAVVTDIDLSTITAESFPEIESVWNQYGVLVFADQHLSDAEHLAFSRLFGRLEAGLKRSAGGTGLGRITNVRADGSVAQPDSLQVRFHQGNLQWHSDSSYKCVGAKASLLAAHVVPKTGGETEWADMRAAWDALDTATQTYLEGKIAVHSYRYSHSWHGGLEIIGQDDLEQLPPVEHPIVRVHPSTGRKNLFVGRHASHILGETEQESRALLKRLTEEGAQAPRTWKHTWRPGDIGVWDNRCVLHRGHEWPLDQPRVMARSTVAGETPDNPWVLEEAV